MVRISSRLAEGEAPASRTQEDHEPHAQPSMDRRDSYHEEGRRERLAAVWAQAGSIPKTKKLTDEEMSAMIGGLFSCESPATNPWGKSVFTVFNAKSIDDILG